MKGGNRDGRRESAIVRRQKNLEAYVASKDTEKAKKAYKDIAYTCRNLKKDVPPKAIACLNQLNIKEADILSAKAQAKSETEELPEEVLGVSYEVEK